MLPSKKYHQGLWICLIAIAALYTLYYNINHPAPGFIRKTVQGMVSPLESAANIPLKGLTDAWKHYLFLVGLAESNEQLKAENLRLTGELIRSREDERELSRLQQLLGLRKTVNHPMLAARVVGRNPSSIFKLIIINRGENDGLRAGLPVLTSLGVAGRILETSWKSSRVLLIIDENSNIDAILQNSRAHGILQGAASAGCKLKYVVKTADVKVGDVVLSSGMDGIFPKGLPLGVVSYVSRSNADMFQKINIAPFVNSLGMEEVLVIMTTQTEGK